MIETWNERMARLARQHRNYPKLEVGDEVADAAANKHEKDIVYAARILEVPAGEVIRKLDELVKRK